MCNGSKLGLSFLSMMKYSKYLQKGCAKLDFNIVPRQLHVYWLCNDFPNDVLRVGITKNPYLIAAKIPDKTHLILFQVDDRVVICFKIRI